MKQSAIFRVSPCRCRCWLNHWPQFGHSPFLNRWTIVAMLTNYPLCGNPLFLKPWKSPFSNVARETDRCHWVSYSMKCRHRSCFPVWYFLSFDGRWWGWNVHLIHLGTIWGLSGDYLGTTDSRLRVDSTTEGLEPYHEFCMFLWMHLFTN